MTGDNTQVYSPIALDLGGKNTGVYMAHRLPDGSIKTEGAVIVLPSDKITWSQASRTAKRHQRRGLTRKRLVRRLLWQILEQNFGFDYETMPTLASAFINGLLKRRGFTYLSSEDGPNPEEYSSVETESLKEFFPAEASVSCVSISDVMVHMSVDMTFLAEIRKSIDAFSESNELDKAQKVKKYLINKCGEKEAGEILFDALKSVRDYGESLEKSLNGGHKPRGDYFKDIGDDIRNSTILAESLFHNTKITSQAFTNLVGNLSNLQLRTLRKYFNDPVEKKGEKLDVVKLGQVLLDWVSSWHTEADSREENHRKNILAEKALIQNDAISYLCKTDPSVTIPPFEDQNNRHPVPDHTLLLDEKKLDLLFPNWREIANLLMMRPENEILLGSLDEICSKQDRKADLGYLKALAQKVTPRPEKEKAFVSFEDKKSLYFMQRLFDRSKSLDPYSLRLLSHVGFENAKNDESGKTGYQGYSALLEVFYGKQFAFEEFERLLKRYYSELNLAKSGLWTDSPAALLRRSDTNTPQKKNIAHILIGNILGVKLNWAGLQKFLDDSEPWKADGRKGFWTALCHIEDTRKSFGNEFKNVYSLAVRQMKCDASNKDMFEVMKCVSYVGAAAKQLQAYFGQTESESEIYRNPFSLAQLYTILKKEQAGFSKTCEALSIENQWRSTTLRLEDGTECARCVRLTADTVKPFDGMLARILERQAKCIADLKVKQIRLCNEGGKYPEEVDISLFFEENAFTFTEGVNAVKTGKKPSKKLQRKLDVLDQRQSKWQDKDERIRAASYEICPYNGSALSGHGEIDHIIPRSATKKYAGTVFNHEANLIYCSNSGNIKKGNSEYSLYNLNPRYLTAVFGTSLYAQISDFIIAELDKLPSGDVDFQELAEDSQKAIRHALFMKGTEAYKKALGFLATQQKTRVNGTQAYLGKLICKEVVAKVRELSPDTKVFFSATKVPAEDVSNFRRWLGDKNDRWVKTNPQPVSSHVRDAMLVLAQGEKNEEGTVFYMSDEALTNIRQGSDSELEPFISRMFPESIEVLQQQRKDNCSRRDLSGVALFNDTIYQEHFVPLWVEDKKLSLGFSDSNKIEIPKQNEAEILYMSVRMFLEDVPENESFDDFVSVEKPTCFPINKKKAIAWLFDASKKGMLDTGATSIFKALEKLRYVTLKKDILATVADAQGKRFLPKDDVDDILGKQKIKVGNWGALIPPFIADWKRLLNAITKLPSNDVEDHFKKLQTLIFPLNDSVLKHKGVRKKFSMPLIPSLSGEMFRVRRKTWTGEYVYQLLASTSFNEGFSKTQDGVTDFSVVEKAEILSRSRNLATAALSGGNSKAQGIATFDEWRECEVTQELQTNGIKRLYLAPGSQDRMKIRCLMRWQEFSAVVKGLVSPLDLPPSTKLGEGNDFMLPKPRADLAIEQIKADEVLFSYIMAATPAAYRHLYNQGTPLN